jgi:outer membrane protein assembly factor BamD (BamD/ComL family)
MSRHICKFVVLGIAIAVLVPVTVAQKPPAPAPPSPPATPPSNSAAPASLNSDPSQSRDDLVMFLRGRIATPDGARVPNDLLVQRVCNNRVRQEVYASLHGDFSMQLGSRTDNFPEGSAEGSSPNGGANRNSGMGISRRELTTCDLRVSASGFQSRVISLMGLDSFGGSIDVGAVVVQRAGKVPGGTLSATPYKAPKDATKAYDKGLQAEKNGKLADADKYFETAVELYPSSANAWFQYGTVLQKENQQDAARKAYTQATTIDTRFLPPYLSLASMAYLAEQWTDVRDLTDHILDLDPLNRVAVNNYILDLDPSNYADAYFYNAMANYKLNKFDDAEKSALKAEHQDLVTHFPQVHLLLAEINARKGNYAIAIGQMQTYLALAPHAQDADRVREQLAKLEKLNGPESNSEKTDQK